MTQPALANVVVGNLLQLGTGEPRKESRVAMENADLLVYLRTSAITASCPNMHCGWSRVGSALNTHQLYQFLTEVYNTPCCGAAARVTISITVPR